jgi:shikimate dehydrogenase
MKLYGLIGYPLGHSFSKEFFKNKFVSEGRQDCFFELFPLENIKEFTLLLESEPSLKGLAVTIPYKQSVIQFLDGLNDEAEMVGAVNCIKFRDGFLTGYNTDVKGFEESFVALLQPHHSKALVLGTGGASRAVQYILAKLKLPFVLVSRNAEAGKGIISYAGVDEVLMKECSIIINCSPVGMSPNENMKPAIPYEYISPEHYLYDLVYKPAETEFLREGKQRGATVKNGYDMLIIQAEENWRIWNEDE